MVCVLFKRRDFGYPDRGYNGLRTRLPLFGAPMLAQLLHVQIAPPRQPLLRVFDRPRINQPQTRFPIGKILTTRIQRISV